MVEDGQTDLVPTRTLGRRSYGWLQISTALDKMAQENQCWHRDIVSGSQSYLAVDGDSKKEI